MRKKSPSAGGKEHDYIGLQDVRGGMWEPIKLEPTLSRDAAAKQCVDAIKQQVHQLDGLVARRLDLIHDNLARLDDRPGPDDEVHVDGRLCKVDAKGYLIVPEPEPATEIEPALVEALIELATGKRRISRSRRSAGNLFGYEDYLYAFFSEVIPTYGIDALRAWIDGL